MRLSVQRTLHVQAMLWKLSKTTSTCCLSLLHSVRPTSSYVTATQQSYLHVADCCDGLQAPDLTDVEPRLASAPSHGKLGSIMDLAL